MTDTTLPLLSSGSAISDGDLFITRQGVDTSDKKVTGTQLKTYMGGTFVPYTGAIDSLDMGAEGVSANSVRVTGNTADTLAYHDASSVLSPVTISNTDSININFASGNLSANFTGSVHDDLIYARVSDVTVDNDMDLYTAGAVLTNLIPDANGYHIYSIESYGRNRVLILVNTSDTHSIILEHDSPSAAESPIYCPNNVDYVLEPRASVYVIEFRDDGIYRVINHSQPPAGATTWGAISGTLSSQTDLQTALDDKVNDSGDTLTGGYKRTYTTLTDASSIAIDLSLNNFFRVTITGDQVLANPTNKPASGDRQVIILEVVQDATGGWTLDFDSDYVQLVTPVLNDASNAVSFITLIATNSTIYVVGYA